MFKVPEKNRVKYGRLGSDIGYGNNGLFFLRQKKNKPDLYVIASDGGRIIDIKVYDTNGKEVY